MDTFLTVLIRGGTLFRMTRRGRSRPEKSGQGDSRQPAVADSRTAAESGDPVPAAAGEDDLSPATPRSELRSRGVRVRMVSLWIATENILVMENNRRVRREGIPFTSKGTAR